MKTIEPFLSLPISFIQNFIRLRSLHKYPRFFDERIKQELDEKLEFLLKDGHTAYTKLLRGECPTCGEQIEWDVGLLDKYRSCYCDSCEEEFDFDYMESIHHELISSPHREASDKVPF